MECYPKLRQKGQVTIPEEIRDMMDLEEGERVKLIVEKIENNG